MPSDPGASRSDSPAELGESLSSRRGGVTKTRLPASFLKGRFPGESKRRRGYWLFLNQIHFKNKTRKSPCPRSRAASLLCRLPNLRKTTHFTLLFNADTAATSLLFSNDSWNRFFFPNFIAYLSTRAGSVFGFPGGYPAK